ncbi:CAMK/CAMKL protein kinase [Saprolegnia diclina VS20]|uniref:CAMK/CAMKL protein kinase n=1 Tax=Saprolegnia diclina (strain VS20) TaxID=1156394 RepID=T0PYH2_SAPDV|nr:CAMK/CAMKL protein kinase [Saprolegnia diclina VS20]EQC30594.1 CAMK/CAMKL protein kinase [Saprolegnia diclina VS20]|eukprot:XP_008615920.1 CAMK/CAMKL protein kinase [Saprolegnia diclina VS20]
MGDFDDDFNEHDVQGRPIKAYKNGCFENPKTLFVQPHWTWDDFLCSCSQRLEMVPMASRVFNSDGVEVDDLMCIEEGDMLFFSTGAPFQIPGQSEAEASSVDNIGSGGVVGGYRVTTLLGRGGFGEVRLGVHQLTNEKVALKFILKSEMGSLGDVERTTTEIQCLTALNHPSIIKLIRVFNEPNHVVLVFELLEGGDLYHHLVHLPSGGLVEEEGALVFSQILSGVGYAHNQHICHRDLKLENILLQNKSDLNSVKIADFGLSDFYRPGAMAKTTCGSISYLPPEVFRGTSNAGPPLDVWSLGVILFAIVCGRLPFEGTDLKGTNRPRENVIRNRIMRAQYKLDETLSPEVTDLITRMLQPDPVERATIPEIFSHPWLRGKASYSSMESLMAASPSKDGDDDDDAEAFTLQIAKHTTDASSFSIPLPPTAASSSSSTTTTTATADENSVDESNKLPKAALRTTSNPLVPTLSGLSTPPSSTLVMTTHHGGSGHPRVGRTLRTGDAKPPHHTRSPRPASTTPVTIPALNTNALVMPKVTPAEKAINCLTPTHSAKRMPATHTSLSVCPKSPKPTTLTPTTDKGGRARRDERPPPIHPMDDRAGTAAKAKRRSIEHSSSEPHGKAIVDSVAATTLEPIG